MSALISLSTVDLSNCDQEPIHIPGFIQPHGILIALDAYGVMTHCSRNAVDILPGLGALGQRLSCERWSPNGELARAVEQVLDETARGDDALPVAFELTLGGRFFDVVVFAFDRRVLIEFERRGSGEDGVPGSFAALAHRSMTRLRRLRSIDAILGEAAQTVRRLTGFDRVTVYRFHHDDSGEVVSEARSDALESYQGMRFPASDIPVQARRLYILNTLRLIANVDDRQVPIDALAVTDVPLDLSHSVLRSISPIHIEYLKNIGVAASMSLSIVVDGRLWGLIACHHATPHRAPYEVRMACDLLAQFVSSAVLEARHHAVALQRTVAADLRARLVDIALRAQDVVDRMKPVCIALQHAMAGDALLVMHRGKHVHEGLSPAGAVLLAGWLEGQASPLVALHELSGLPAELRAAMAPYCGVLAMCFDRPRRGWIVLLRRDQFETIIWNGPPAKVERIGPLGDRLTPRGSLASWRQVVEGQAVPWDEVDQALALQLVDELNRASMLRNSDIEAARIQLLAMLGHDLRDPLQTMAMVGQVLSHRDPGSPMAHRIATSTGRMQRLISQVLDMSRLSSGDGLCMLREDVDVAALVHALVDEARFAYPSVAIELEAPATLFAHVAGDRIAQVFSNLVSNARHHGVIGEPVHIALAALSNGLRLTIANVASPIPPDQIDMMFDPLKRTKGSTVRNPGGLGLGLYIAREVVRGHCGTLVYSHDGTHVIFTMELGA